MRRQAGVKLTAAEGTGGVLLATTAKSETGSTRRNLNLNRLGRGRIFEMIFSKLWENLGLKVGW
jgi:hypothetical protein